MCILISCTDAQKRLVLVSLSLSFSFFLSPSTEGEKRELLLHLVFLCCGSYGAKSCKEQTVLSVCPGPWVRNVHRNPASSKLGPSMFVLHVSHQASESLGYLENSFSLFGCCLA